MVLIKKSAGARSAGNLTRRGLKRRPEFLIVDGAAGLDSAIAAVWGGVPTKFLTYRSSQVLAGNPQVIGSIRRECLDHFRRGPSASNSAIIRALLQRHQDPSIAGQGCAGFSPGSADREHQIVPGAGDITTTSGYEFSVHTPAALSTMRNSDRFKPRLVAGTLSTS